MGFRELSLKLPTDFSTDDLRKQIANALHLSDFSYQIITQSLDARKKDSIHWLVRIGITAKELKGGAPTPSPTLYIPYKKRNKNIVVVGSGPAGLFSALILQQSGFSVTLIERGKDVDARASSIATFENGGRFDPAGNYTFGEGGAGTFSDGKLTSRSKHIAKEQSYILAQYIAAGAPEAIAYLAHPHLGSDRLRSIVKKLRQTFQALGGDIQFETTLKHLSCNGSTVKEIVVESSSEQKTIKGDIFIIATGHSAYETFRLLIELGVKFRTKPFAMGARVEHPQTLINEAQWGKPTLSGVLAAEYRLTSTTEGHLPVYTFCMCPGGTVVPATAYPNQSSVNGMSLQARNGQFANAGCVAAINLDLILGSETTPLAALDWVEALERLFFNSTKAYALPACRIKDFIDQTVSGDPISTSYPRGLELAPLWELFPERISTSIRAGLIDFSRKLKGFETGTIMGLESKTSSPLQVLREESRVCVGFENLYLSGEGSGHSGGIMSSAADGITLAMRIIA